jgi:Cu(I)/Ag(I) efflux system membrane protein CusA/SilA
MRSRRCWAVTLDPAMRMLFTRMDSFTFPPGLAGARGLGAAGRHLPCGREAPDQPRSLPRLRAGVPLRVAPSVEGDRSGFASGRRGDPAYFRLGSEFMPPLHEGTILYMPTTLPGISVAQAQELLTTQDRVPEVVPRGGARFRQGR